MARSDLPVAVGPTTATTRPSTSVAALVLGRLVVVAERVAVLTRHPRQAGHSPAVALHGLARLARPLAGQPVDVEETVEVVVLVLQHPGEPAGRLVADLGAVEGQPGQGRSLAAPQRVGLARDRQAPLDLLVRVGLADDRLGRGEVRVEDHAARRDAVVVGELPGEDPQAHAHLGCGQADPAGGIHGVEHVGDEFTDAVVDDLHGLGAAVEDGFAGDDDRSDGHAEDSSRGPGVHRTGTPPARSSYDAAMNPSIVLVAPEHAADLTDEFGRYARDYDVLTTTSVEEAEAVAHRVVDGGGQVAMFVAESQLPGYHVLEAFARWRTVVPTARRLVAAHWSHFLADAPALRGGLAKGKYDAFLLMPRGVRDEEFHTAICEMLSDWGSTVAAPEVDTVRIVTPAPDALTLAIRDFLDRMGMPNRTYSPDSERGRDVIERASGTPV